MKDRQRQQQHETTCSVVDNNNNNTYNHNDNNIHGGMLRNDNHTDVSSSSSSMNSNGSSSNNRNHHNQSRTSSRNSNSNSPYCNYFCAGFACFVSVVYYYSCCRDDDSSSFWGEAVTHHPIFVFVSSLFQELVLSWRSSQQRQQQHRTNNPEMSCTDESLSHFLHDIQVSGLHVVCLRQITNNTQNSSNNNTNRKPTTIDGVTVDGGEKQQQHVDPKQQQQQELLPLQMIVYPMAQKTSHPVRVEINNKNNNKHHDNDNNNHHRDNHHTIATSSKWSRIRSGLVSGCGLERPTTDGRFRRPWNVFSTDGQWLIGEESSASPLLPAKFDNDIVQRLLRSEILLLYEGGQFIWPGVRIGYQRQITLYNNQNQNNQNNQNNNNPNKDKNNNENEKGKEEDVGVAVTLETLSLQPLVLLVKGFLSHDECASIQSLAERSSAMTKDSSVVLMDKDRDQRASDFRTSQSTFLFSYQHALLRKIDDRTSRLVKVPTSHQEHVQVLRYKPSERYLPHHDYFDPELYQNDPNTLRLTKNGRNNRMATVLWYLSDVEEGGETYFPRYKNIVHGSSSAATTTSSSSSSWSSGSGNHQCRGLRVRPEKGKVILFYSLLPDGTIDPLSLHGACSVKEGIKWAANKWVWNAPMNYFNSFF